MTSALTCSTSPPTDRPFRDPALYIAARGNRVSEGERGARNRLGQVLQLCLIAGEADVRPAERRDVREQVVRRADVA
jgi:hypothetical protein